MINVAYYSLSGNTRDFISWYLADEVVAHNIEDGDLAVPYVLITPTYGRGEVPPTVAEWLVRNGDHLIGIAGTGNANWGDNFAKAVDIIAEQYSVPIVSKFELKGTKAQAQHFIDSAKRLYGRCED